jgi:uroporphyrinogen decarboxylase
MNKQERVLAALNGKEVDYIPYSMWYHFGTQFLPGEKAAEIQLAYYDRYDFDYLKLMNDYTYPLPDGLERINSINDWNKMRPVPLSHPCFAEQLKIVRLAAKHVKGKAFFQDTIFNPLGVARRSAKDIIFTIMRSHPDDFKRGMEIIAESIRGYIAAVLAEGAAGIFFSINGGADDLMTTDEFNEFVRPYDLYVLETVKNKTVFNTAHVHGYKLLFEEVADYPVEAFNWSHLHSEPSLAQAKEMTPACLIGGIDERLTNMFHPSEIEAQIKEAFRMTGGKHFMLGPGCAVPTDLPPEHFDLIRDTIRKR